MESITISVVLFYVCLYTVKDTFPTVCPETSSPLFPLLQIPESLRHHAWQRPVLDALRVRLSTHFYIQLGKVYEPWEHVSVYTTYFVFPKEFPFSFFPLNTG